MIITWSGKNVFLPQPTDECDACTPSHNQTQVTFANTCMHMIVHAHTQYLINMPSDMYPTHVFFLCINTTSASPMKSYRLDHSLFKVDKVIVCFPNWFHYIQGISVT